MSEDNFIEPAVFAGEKRSLSRTFLLNELDARLSQHEYILSHDAQIHARLQGGRDRKGRDFIDLSLRAALSLRCQRCLEAMDFSLDETAHLLVFPDEAAAENAKPGENDEVLIAAGQADIREWVEDQILTALPFAPRHEDCGSRDLTAFADTGSGPFAVLAQIGRTGK